MKAMPGNTVDRRLISPVAIRAASRNLLATRTSHVNPADDPLPLLHLADAGCAECADARRKRRDRTRRRPPEFLNN
jgi:hypothetical protein